MTYLSANIMPGFNVSTSKYGLMLDRGELTNRDAYLSRIESGDDQPSAELLVTRASPLFLDSRDGALRAKSKSSSIPRWPIAPRNQILIGLTSPWATNCFMQSNTCPLFPRPQMGLYGG